MDKNEKIRTSPFDASKLQIRNDEIYAFQKIYGLTNVEFRILETSESKWKEWHKRFYLILIGLILTVVSKGVFFLIKFNNSNSEERASLNIDINAWELIYLGIGLFLSVTCYLLSESKWAKNEKSELVNKIKEHFKNAGN
ncbi:hypothetical protein EDC17_101136 [Sphingobacterium alimentarium]|uniref:Uncharacterized protein n=1 Tax=Sphingobacterium alimentarium TaxID=797292 RepID=A0A4R3VXW1_9SPHI|nr:hypothetical protein [Sphingobacterium alimentarium]TCV17119.1 hypothetical protein EDC17_101136 [Sphingobacterium alimentarium]